MHQHLGPYTLLSRLTSTLRTNGRVVFYTTSKIRYTDISDMLPSISDEELVNIDVKNWRWMRGRLCSLLSGLAWSESLLSQDIFVNIVEVDQDPRNVEYEALGVLYCAFATEIEESRLSGKLFGRSGVLLHLSITYNYLSEIISVFTHISTSIIRRYLKDFTSFEWDDDFDEEDVQEFEHLPSSELFLYENMTGKVDLFVELKH